MENVNTVSAEQAPSAPKKKKNRIKIRPAQIVLNAVTILLLLFTLFPFYVMIVNTFKTPTQFLTDPLGLPTEWVFTYFRFAWEYVKNYLDRKSVV